MRESELGAFMRSIGDLFDAYGRHGDDKEFKRKARAYFRHLMRFELDEIEEAIDNATDRYRDYMPTAGQLASLIGETRRKNAEAAEARAREQAERNDRKATEDYYRTQVPKTRGAVGEWVSEGATCFDRLARRWECEIAAGLGEMHGQSDWGKDKAGELWKLWNKHERGDCGCASKCSPPEPQREAKEFTYAP